MQQHQYSGAPEAPATLQNNFNLQALNDSFAGKSVQDRLRLIHDWFHAHMNGQLALTSSFGIQSALLIHYAKESGLSLPVVSVDIADPKYNEQRSYRDHLQREIGLELLNFSATNDDEKVAAMDNGLRHHFITATIAGIRASQTKERSAKKFVEWNERNGTLTFHPLLDWPDAKTDYYIERHIPEDLRHPAYAPGVQSKGGAVLAAGTEKTECGLHFDGSGI